MHLKKLSENFALHEDYSFESDLLDVEQPIFEELDYDISIDEIRECIRYLKRNKSCNEDYMLNEIFIDFVETIISVLYKLFNAIFRSGFLVSCMGKLLTTILNKRLLKWDKDNSVIMDAQFGFTPGLGTVDAMLVLQSLVHKYFRRKGGRLYCCFIDYRKAFDFVNRSKLWIKLTKIGIQGKILKIIKSLYENIK